MSVLMLQHERKVFYPPGFALRVVLVLSLIIVPAGLYAQWFNDGPLRNESRIATPGLAVVPEYHTDMSLDCMVGYIAMDSVTHSVDRSYISSFLRRTSLDTLRLISRFMYAVVDYNPVLFHRYIVTTRDSAWSGNSAYKSYPAELYYGVLDKEIIGRRLGSFGLDYAMLLSADYILHVRISDKRMAMDSSSVPKMYVGAACEVLEIFKGQHLPDNCYYPAAVEVGGQAALGGSDCIKFGYPRDWPTRAGIFLQNVPDTVSGCATMREVQQGEEYIVFLGLGASDEYTQLVYPVNSFERAGGLFRIVNGKVEDPSNFWGLGTQPSLQDFRSHLLQKINDVKTWSTQASLPSAIACNKQVWFL